MKAFYYKRFKKELENNLIFAQETDEIPISSI